MGWIGSWRSSACSNSSATRRLSRRLWLDAMRGRSWLRGLDRHLRGHDIGVPFIGGTCLPTSRSAQRMAADLPTLARARTGHDRAIAWMSAAIQHPRSLDWNPVRFEVTEDTPDGPPVRRDGRITLYENPSKTNLQESDASGIADFGSLTLASTHSRSSGTLANGPSNTRAD